MYTICDYITHTSSNDKGYTFDQRYQNVQTMSVLRRYLGETNNFDSVIHNPSSYQSTDDLLQYILDTIDILQLTRN